MSEVEVATRLLTASAYRKDVDRIRYRADVIRCRTLHHSSLQLHHGRSGVPVHGNDSTRRHEPENPSIHLCNGRILLENQGIVSYLKAHIWCIQPIFLASFQGILALTPRSATINFDKYCNDENQMLATIAASTRHSSREKTNVRYFRYLWHGTKAVNLMSILKDGFLVNPPHSSITGRLFGDVSHDLLRIWLWVTFLILSYAESRSEEHKQKTTNNV